MSDDAGKGRKGPGNEPATGSFFNVPSAGTSSGGGLFDVAQMQQMAREREQRERDQRARDEAAERAQSAARAPSPRTPTGEDGQSALIDLQRLTLLAQQRQEETRVVQEALARAEREREAAERRAAEELRLRERAEAEAARLRAQAEAAEAQRLADLRAQIEFERRARIELQIAHDLKLAQIQADANARRVSTTTALTFVVVALVLVAGAGVFGRTYVESAARAMALESQDGQPGVTPGTGTSSEDSNEETPSVFSSLSSLFGGGGDRRPSEP